MNGWPLDAHLCKSELMLLAHEYFVQAIAAVRC